MLAVSKTIRYPLLPNVYTFYWLNYPIHQLKKTHHQHTKIYYGLALQVFLLSQPFQVGMGKVEDVK